VCIQSSQEVELHPRKKSPIKLVSERKKNAEKVRKKGKKKRKKVPPAKLGERRAQERTRGFSGLVCKIRQAGGRGCGGPYWRGEKTQETLTGGTGKGIQDVAIEVEGGGGGSHLPP